MSGEAAVKTYPILIGEQRLTQTAGGAIDVRSPIDGNLAGRVPRCGVDEVNQAVEAAHEAFGKWSIMPANERARLLYKAAAAVRANIEPMARLLTVEMGKPLADSRKEIADGATTLEYFAVEGTRLGGEIAPYGAPHATGLVIKEPLGVCAAIAPWNYPVSLVGWKIAPALAAGCTVVVKPSTETPLAALEFLRVLLDSGLPAGVINAVTGRGAEVGDPLVEHPLVRKVSFTGTTKVGQALLAKAAPGLKKVTLELGGHSPLLVFADADFAKAVAAGVKRSFRNAGQICNAVNRIFVEKSIYERYLAAFVDKAKAMTLGDPLANPDIDNGPMLNARGVAKAKEHVADAVAKGARLLCGGATAVGPEYKSDLYFLPTVLADCTLAMKVMVEETFGPVVGIAPFEDLPDALRLANSTEFGLVSYAYTGSLATTKALAGGIQSGTVCINNIVGSTLEAPYSGWKASGGLGFELSRHALDEHLRVKHVRIEV